MEYYGNKLCISYHELVDSGIMTEPNYKYKAWKGQIDVVRRGGGANGCTTANMTWTDFHYYSVQRGMQQIDALMHSRIANLFYAWYGRLNAQEQCGAGSHSSTRTIGETASRGMTDTIGYEAAKSINGNVTNSLVDNAVHQFAWYKSADEYGGAAVTQINNICCLGYEDIYGHDRGCDQ